MKRQHNYSQSIELQHNYNQPLELQHNYSQSLKLQHNYSQSMELQLMNQHEYNQQEDTLTRATAVKECSQYQTHNQLARGGIAWPGLAWPGLA